MALHWYRYYYVGPTLRYLQQHAANVTAIAAVRPVITKDVQADDAVKADVDDAMTSQGWAYLEIDPPVDGAKTINQIVTSVLTADAGTISGSWADVLSVEIQSNGGSLAMQAAAVATVTLATAQLRLIINGGAFPVDTVIGAPVRELDRLGLNDTAFNHPVALPDGAPGPDGSKAYTTYTVKLQIQRTGLGTVTPLKGCVLTCVEYR